MTRSISRAGAAFGAALLVIALSAAPALACGGLIGPNGAVNLLRTTTFAGYHDGVEHYVTAFQFAGGGGAFGSITPLPGHPVERREGRRLDPPAPRSARPSRSPARGRSPRPRRGAAGSAEELMKVTIDALDITVLRGGAGRGRRVGHATTASGSRRTRPRSSTSTPRAARSSSPPRSTPTRPPSAARQVGDGTPVHITIPTDNPWVPLRILALGKTAAERVEADVYLLTDRAPALLPAPTGDNGMRPRPQRRRRPSRCSTTCAPTAAWSWVPASAWLTKVAHRRRGAAARLRPRDRRVRGRSRRRASHGRARPAGRRRPGASADRRSADPRSALAFVVGRHRRDPAADPLAPAASTARPWAPAADDRASPAGRAWPWSAASPSRSALAGIAAAWAAPGPRSGHGRDHDPLLALRAGRGDACRPACRSRSCSRNDDPIDHEWIVGDAAVHERHRTGTEPVHASRPTEVTIPAGTSAYDDGHVHDAGHVPVHLPPARPRGLRHGRHAGARGHGRLEVTAAACVVDRRQVQALDPGRDLVTGREPQAVDRRRRARSAVRGPPPGRPPEMNGCIVSETEPPTSTIASSSSAQPRRPPTAGRSATDAVSPGRSCSGSSRRATSARAAR